MDAAELARQVAADLHAQAVARGADPWRPLEFAIAEAERRSVDVEPTNSGAAVLDGGRAIFIPRDRLILYENAGTPFEQAFLIAHELGHVELGDDSENTIAGDVDYARSAEPSPVGVDRVVDYGRKQRREVQMDLFAREFLLPRATVRSLHLDDGLSATDIATRLGAPFDLVAQQLFDALLLPPIQPESQAERIDRPLNPEQQAAADHRGIPYLLEAGPGTGKTQTLTARVGGLLASGVDPSRILVLTFSNKAAREMAGRIALKQKVAAAAMWIGTFHAFGLDLIRRFHAELGLVEDPRIMDRTEAVELLEDEFTQLGFVHNRNVYDPTQIIADMLAAVSRAKDEMTDANQYGVFAGDMLAAAKTTEEVEAAERAAEVAKFYQCYESLKGQKLCVDFGDLVSLPVRLLENSTAIRQHIQTQYDHVLVDEYQDVNRASVRLLAALRPNGENLWVVGDGKQSIYRFRGASSFNMTRFGNDDFPGGVRGRLKVNYRSREEIVGAFSHFAIEMKAASGDSTLTAFRGTGGHPAEYRSVDSNQEQTVALADAIEEMRQSGYDYRDQALLCTGNDRLSALGQELERLGIPTLFLGSLFERPEIKDLLALLSILTDRRAMGLVRIGCWPEFMLPLADVAGVLDCLRANTGGAIDWINDRGAIASLSSEGQTALGRIAAVIQGFEPNSRPWTVLASVLLDRTRLAARLAQSASVVDRSRGIAIWQFLNFVRGQPSGRGLPITRLLDRVRRLVRLADERDLRQLPAAAQGINAVRLTTVHGAKGLEFPVVHIPGMNAGTLPRTPPAPPCPPPDGMIAGGTGSALEVFRLGQAEEQECLFYVALSRARDRLLLYSPTQKSNGASHPASAFLSRLGPLNRNHVVPQRTLPVAPEETAIPLAIDGGLSFTGPQLALYESCPRRFLYTHVLHVGGRRTLSAFMMMHEAVREAFESIVAEPALASEDSRLDRLILEACKRNGLAGNGYLADFLALAHEMINYFLATRNGLSPEPPEELRLAFGIDEILLKPDDVLIRSDGLRAVRRVRTGHRRSTEGDDVGAAALLLGARQIAPNAVAELVHLSDLAIHPIGLSANQLTNRRKKLADFLARIRSGQFPTKPSVRTCPGCPAFFICGPVPAGTLPKKFR
jgi:superfamily I DNA/RNA helicase/Zn-dependent peptidase ImmA (M78 family)